MSTPVRLLLAVSCVCPLLGGCQSDSGGGSTLGNYLMFNSATPPPVAAAAAIDVPDCPQVDVTESGAAAKRGAVQVSVTNVARECSGRPDGSIVVKVGIEGRALAGPGGGSGRFDENVYFVLKRGDRVLAQRDRRVAVTIPAGDTQGSFYAVEDGLVVPPGIGGEFEVEAGLGSAGRAQSGPSRNTVRLRRQLPTRS